MDIFHRHRQANEHDAAATALERALQIPEYRAEALVWKGIAALPQTPELAFLFFANASKALPDRADVHALVGRSLLAQGKWGMATRYLTNAWKLQPNDLALRLTLWEARSRSETPAELRRMVLAHLPDIQTGKELGLVLKLLAAQSDAAGTIGVVRYLPEQKEIQGWAIDLQNLQAPAALVIEANGARINAAANSAHPLLSAAGLPATHGGLRVSVPNPTTAVHLQFANGTPLLGSPVYAMPVFIPPASVGGGENNPVDVLIPVYNGIEETLECINSALDARKLNRTPHRLVVIEDKTPVPALVKALKVLAAKGKITLINNAVNLGFIRTINRAMALSPNKDVVWLNADTRVHGAWLDRLREVAYSDEHIASVTPFTNNGELMSFPRSQICHEMPSAKAQAELDELARQVASPPVEIETGCGFCLYIKRAALDQIGYLDEVHLARGYGEETDWCLRARSHGWRHMGAPNVFVAHQGGISFGAEKVMRVAVNNATLRKRYPDASSRYKAFCLRDPIKPARQALQRARLEHLATKPTSEQRSSWQTVTDTTLYIHDGFNDDADFSLTYHQSSHRTFVSLTAPLHPLPLNLEFELPADFNRLVECLGRLPLQAIVFQNLTNCPLSLCDLPAMLDIPYSIQCNDDRLLDQGSDYDWRRFAQKAASVQLPWTALRLRYSSVLPDAKLATKAATVSIGLPSPPPQSLVIGDSLRDATIAHRWLEVARHIKRTKLSTRLVAPSDGPLLKLFQATGTVHVLPDLDGFTLVERAQAAGCDAVLSLAENPGSDWAAPGLAAQLGLPLFAPSNLLASETGAAALTSLPFTPSLAR
ncbi:glycosyltransferase [Pseudomonas sp. SGAir0191]|uniref:glycosyltransferase family 2 protein n=1 Tax=Pseudomonas sp. SGAir0191 TaxID=2217867 RepID=UPI000C2C3520|nr:glycosyltransferase family 2 protein [Pseudomonas sp. SGAir0191]AUA32248.1 glycosyltransferase [Pseudomonas sp. SGAir0191]